METLKISFHILLHYLMLKSVFSIRLVHRQRESSALTIVLLDKAFIFLSSKTLGSQTWYWLVSYSRDFTLRKGGKANILWGGHKILTTGW